MCYCDDDSDDQVPLWCCADLWMACRPNLVKECHHCTGAAPIWSNLFRHQRLCLLACLEKIDDEDVKIALTTIGIN